MVYSEEKLAHQNYTVVTVVVEVVDEAVHEDGPHVTEELTVSLFFFSSRRRHTRCSRDWSSDVCSSDLVGAARAVGVRRVLGRRPRGPVAEGPLPARDRAVGIAALVGEAAGEPVAAGREIGRASCRERV